MAKYPFLTNRSGSQNWYYKRDIPPELRAPSGRNKSGSRWEPLIERALKEPAPPRTPRLSAALPQWRQDDNQAVASSGTENAGPSATNPIVAPLTPALLRKIADSPYLNIYENDFDWRSDDASDARNLDDRVANGRTRIRCRPAF